MVVSMQKLAPNQAVEQLSVPDLIRVLLAKGLFVYRKIPRIRRTRV
jgi:hypothetical protein